VLGGTTYGESVRLRASIVDFGAGGRSKRAGPRVCNDMIGSRSDGLLFVSFGDFAMLRVIWPKPMRSRNAVYFRFSFDQCDGHLVMLHSPAVAHGIWASGRVGISR
jgi:hypothetical protein